MDSGTEAVIAPCSPPASPRGGGGGRGADTSQGWRAGAKLSIASPRWLDGVRRFQSSRVATWDGSVRGASELLPAPWLAGFPVAFPFFFPGDPPVTSGDPRRAADPSSIIASIGVQPPR